MSALRSPAIRSGWLLWPVALAAVGLVVEARDLFPGLRFAINRSPADMPSTLAVRERDRTAGYPLLSVAVEGNDLFDRQRGLLANPMGHGRDWERFAYVSFFDKGRLRIATGAGLRVHGGRSRVVSEKKSFRLFFRRRYGDALIPADALFGPPRSFLSRLVLHNDVRIDRAGRRWQFTNPLAYDIAARIGSITARTLPVRFLLNGEPQGVYVITEYIDEAFFEARFGHGDFEMESSATSLRLRAWAQSTEPFDMAVASGSVDVDNLTRWVISILFCGTTDIWQGTLARDRRAPDPKWFWVNWDMDHSFMDLYQRADVPWEIDTFRSLLGAPDARSRILGRLLKSDPAYRQFFAETVSAVLNHRLTPAFLSERLNHYRIVAAIYGIENREFLDRVERFFAARPAVVRRLVQRHAGAGPDVEVRVRIPDGVALDVDGHRTTGLYEGRYFSGFPITVGVPKDAQAAFSGWTVNGSELPQRGPSLTLSVQGPLDISPRFSGQPDSPPARR
jgi:hypothetical protein